MSFKTPVITKVSPLAIEDGISANTAVSESTTVRWKSVILSWCL